MSAKDLRLTKVVGTANPADMLSKHLAIADLQRTCLLELVELSSITDAVRIETSLTTLPQNNNISIHIFHTKLVAYELFFNFWLTL